MDLSRPVAAQAIVILGGGIRRQAAEFGRDTLGLLTLERVRYGAYVARMTGLPILVTGGGESDGESEAKVMRDALQDEFGVPVRWAEPLSRNTHENARNSVSLLKAEGIARIVLVTHVFDVRRARLEFESAGVSVTSAPTGAGQPSANATTISDFFPTARALQESYYACYELLALLARPLLYG